MNINDKIAEVKNRIKELTKHFPYTEFEINMLTISYIAIAAIDNDITDILDITLARCYVLFNNGEFNDFLSKHYEDSNLTLDFYQEPTFTNEKISQNDFIVISSYPTRAVFDILEGLEHELKHALNSTIKSFKIHDDIASFYCGFCEFINKKDYFRYLEEVFNSFMTKVYLDQISKLSEFEIADEGIRFILEKFKITTPPTYNYLYERITNLCLPLFNNPELFPLFYNASLYKDFNPLFDALSKMLNEKSSYVFGILLSSYYEHNFGLILKYFTDFDYSNIDELSLESHYKHI